MANCYNLHIRTPESDPNVSNNIITQNMVATGMKIGFVPESDRVGQYKFNVIVKNSDNVILYITSSMILSSYTGAYVYFIIPTLHIPAIGEVINIKIVTEDNCMANVDYTIASYTMPVSTTSTTINLGNTIIDKYIKVKPNTNSGGFNISKTYYYKCSTNNMSADECFIEFTKNQDMSRVLDSLPENSSPVVCPPTLKWLLVDTMCVAEGEIATTTTKTPCSNGLTLLSIINTSGDVYKVTFDAMDVQSITWTLFNSSGLEIKTGNSGTLTSSSFNVNFGTLLDGTYTFKIKADNCSSSILNGTKSFTVAKGNTTTSTTTTSGSLPSCNLSGSFTISSVTKTTGTNYSVAYNGSNLTSAVVKLYTELEPTVELLSKSVTISSSSFTVDLGSRGDGNYILKLIGTSCSGTATKLFTIGSITTVAPVSSFLNLIKGVPVETAKGKYNPSAFPKSGIIDTVDPVLGVSYPNWAIAWQCEGGNFKANNRVPADNGIPFMYDVVPAYYSGIGVHGVDYIYEMNPNNGCFWGQERNGDGLCQGTINNIDTTGGGSGINIDTFDSAIPFNRRGYATFGLAGEGNRTRWQNMSDRDIYYDGINSVSGGIYGKGGRVNGKSKVGLSNADIEIGYELGQSGTNKHFAFLKGMHDGSQGYVFSQYSGAFMSIDITPESYQNADGTYPPYRLNVDRTPRLGDNNELVASLIPTSSDWNPSSTLNIPDLGISGVKITDLTKVLICVEVSSLASEALRHNSVYDKTGRGNLVTVNKFGANRNTQHIIAYTKFLAEVNRDWSDKHLNGRRVMLQSKITCDRANMGIFIDAGFTNTAFEFYHHDRRTSFLIGGFTAMSGCEWQIWDRNTDQYLDGYHGALGLIHLFKQRKSFGNGISESYESLKPRLKWLLHKSEISYDNGGTWVKETADKYVMDFNSIPHSQAITDDGYWVGFFGRPEGIEKTSCKVRVNYNGNWHYHTINTNMWETVSYEHRNKALSEIPVLDKDYYYFIFKLSGNGGEVS